MSRLARRAPTRRLTKDAWTAITAITVALISALVTLITHYVPAPPAR